MDLFRLPQSTIVNKVIPKNAFDAYTNSKQKKLFTDAIARITWLNKLSPETINLEAQEIVEIQVIGVELKVKQDVQQILEIIDKSIPYHIVFLVEFENLIYISTSSKHPHPLKNNISVIDWTFKTDWFASIDNKYQFHLKKNIDVVYHDFCVQISENESMSTRPLIELIEYNKRVYDLEKEIARVQASISKCKQFNVKVDLNLKLKNLEKELKELT